MTYIEMKSLVVSFELDYSGNKFKILIIYSESYSCI